MKKLVVFLSLLVVLHLPYSCTEDDCGEFRGLESKITAITTEVGSFANNEFTNVTTNDFNTAAIRFEISEMEFSEIAMYRKKGTNLFVKQAMACSAPEPELAYDISNINITGESQISTDGATVAAGQSLNSLFKVTDSGDIAFNTFIQNLSKDRQQFGNIGAAFTLALVNEPDQPIDQQLTIKFDFSDGSFIELKTDTFYVE
ncbi:MAG: hypothetical protein AAF149_24035 [Bacteroidota bacterium]